MARAFDAAFAAMCSALAAVLFFDSRAPHSAVQIVLPLAEAATVALFASVALVFFRHLNYPIIIAAAGGGGGGGDRRLSDLVTFTLCVSVGTLQYVFFVQPAGVVIISVGALGLTAAAVTFFLGSATALVHVRAGGGGRGGVDVAGEGTTVRVLSKMAIGAATALVTVVGIVAVSLDNKY